MPKESPLYQVIGWSDNFEGAKSKTYNNKSTCQMPTKHGLGFKKLIRNKNGSAMFGAWCALIQILSRHPKPREGYLTDTGSDCGIPMTPEDLELLTGIPEKVFFEMLQVCSSQQVGWLRILRGYRADTVDAPQYPLNSDLDLDLDSDSDLNNPGAADGDNGKKELTKTIGFDYKNKVFVGITDEVMNMWSEAYPAIDPLYREIAKAGQWLLANPTKRKKNVFRFLVNWLSRCQERGGSTRPSSSKPDDRENRDYGL